MTDKKASTLKTEASADVRAIIQMASNLLKTPAAAPDAQTLATNVLSHAANIGDCLVGITTTEQEAENLLSVIGKNIDACLIENPVISVDDQSLNVVEAVMSLSAANGVLSDRVCKYALDEKSLGGGEVTEAVGRAGLALIALCEKLNIEFLEAITLYYNSKKD